MANFKNIVVALDFSRTSQEALDVACGVAAGREARLHLLHVVANARHQPAAMETPGVELDALQRQWTSAAEARLAELAPAADQASITRQVVIGAPVADAIRDYALSHHADLIVVGTHGYGPVKRLLLGSVSDHLLRCAPCPVLTVPPGSSPPEPGTRSQADHVGS
jgi:nucleotide-binding universal stress UspA family protein